MKKSPPPNITIEKTTNETLFRRATSTTARGRTIKMTLATAYRSEHSPIRTQRFFIEMKNIYSYVSVHFIRHPVGVTHYIPNDPDTTHCVTSNRLDRGGTGEEDRYTPVDHVIDTNAQSLINIARSRLCFKADRTTVATMQRIKRKMYQVDTDLALYLVPECVYRNGLCPEPWQCDPGIEKVMNAYTGYAQQFK